MFGPRVFGPISCPESGLIFRPEKGAKNETTKAASVYGVPASRWVVRVVASVCYGLSGHVKAYEEH